MTVPAVSKVPGSNPAVSQQNSRQNSCEDFALRRGSLNQLLPSPVVVKKAAAPGISAAKRRHLVGRCHSDTSQLQGV